MGPFKNKVKKTKSFKTTFLRNNNRCLELYASSKFLFHVLMMMMYNNKQTNKQQTNKQQTNKRSIISINHLFNQSINHHHLHYLPFPRSIHPTSQAFHRARERHCY